MRKTLEVLKKYIVYSKRCQSHFLRYFRIIYGVARVDVVYIRMPSAMMAMTAAAAAAAVAAASLVLSVIIHLTTYHRQHQSRGLLRPHWKIIRSHISDRVSSNKQELYLPTITATNDE
jgi:prolipoprotein diacylglyceryltransferase